MIRIAVIADTVLRARNVADLLAEDERLEIVEARAAGSRAANFSRMVDVVVLVGVRPDLIPNDGPPIVALLAGGEPEIPLSHAVRASLPLHASEAEISAAITAAANELTVLTSDQVRRWMRAPESAGEKEEGVVEALTARELQVLRALSDGFGNKEIAGQLGISNHTAKFHVAQILAKLGAGSRTEAVAIGIRRGLIPI